MAQDSNEYCTSAHDFQLKTTSANNELRSDNSLQQLPLITPQKDAGLNPLVDAAARLFSIIGKLQQLKTCNQPEQLHADILAEINSFQKATEQLDYSPEHVLASRYAISATLDDIIAQTPWGTESAWKGCSQEGIFGIETGESSRFFLIIDRVFQNPGQYIDLMEFMYICLSLGFRGSFKSTEYGHKKLEQISDALYRKIRSHHGDFSRTLSPFAIKAPQTSNHRKFKKISPPFFILSTASSILILFVSLGVALDTMTSQTQTQLAEIGNKITHETTNV